jgi:hypothetical protein
MLPAMGDVRRFNLMAVGLVDTERTIGGHEIGVNPFGPRLMHGFTGGDGADMTQLFRVRAAAQQGNQGVMGVHPNIVSPGGVLRTPVRHGGNRNA